MGKLARSLAIVAAVQVFGCAATAPANTANSAADTAGSTDAVADGTSVNDASAAADGLVVADTKQDAVPDSAQDTSPAAGAGQWCVAWAAATCALWTKCPLVVGGQTSEQCAQSLQKECLGSALLQQSLSAGKLKFDEAKAAQCLADLKKVDCPTLYKAMVSQPGAAVAACGQALAGQQPPGADCHIAIECAAGSQCVFGTGCPGKCQAWSKVGQSCSVEKPCEPLVAACAGGICAALSNAVGGKCVDYQCAAPLYCDFASNTCAQFGLEQAPCTTTSQHCWAGLTCFAPAGQAGTCKPVAPKGAACFSQANCNPLGPEGPLLCIGGSCQVGPGPGAPCYDWQCSGAWCDAAALPPTCKAWPSLGNPCAMAALCGPGAVCVAGKCKALVGPGQPCQTAGDCQTGVCSGGKCAGNGIGPCG